MRPSEILRNLGRPIAYYPRLAPHVGGVKATLFLCQLFYWSDKAHSEMGVYKTCEEWEEETGLSYREQASARKTLTQMGLMHETHKRLEHKIYYCLDLEAFDDLLLAICENGDSRNAESAIGGSTKAHFVHTENTTETTSESLGAEAPVADAPETPKKAKASSKFDPIPAKPANVSAESWSDWCQHRREIRKPLTAKTCEQQAKALLTHPTPDAVINLSISNGWTGLFPDKVMPTTSVASRHNGFADRDYNAGLTAREGGGYAF